MQNLIIKVRHIAVFEAIIYKLFMLKGKFWTHPSPLAWGLVVEQVLFSHLTLDKKTVPAGWRLHPGNEQTKLTNIIYSNLTLIQLTLVVLLF